VIRVSGAVSEPVMLRVGAASPPEVLSAIGTSASPVSTVVVAGKNFSPAATVDLRVDHGAPPVPAMSGLKVVTAEEIRFDLDSMGLFNLGLENIGLLATVVNAGGVRSNEVKIAWR
jgi:hypothetical protein